MNTEVKIRIQKRRKLSSSYLSSNLKWLLKQHNITMAELARRCHLAAPVLFRVVTGQISNPQINTILPIAKYFHCSLDDLLTTNLAKIPQKSNIKKEYMNTSHQTQNGIAIINTVLQGIQKIFPALLECYHVVPEDLRPQQLSLETLQLLPELLENGLKAVTHLKINTHQLKEKTDET